MKRLRAVVGALFFILAVFQPHLSTSAQTRKDKDGTPIPDIQVLNYQYTDRPQPDNPGEIPPILVKGTVRNNTDDRVITGILWKISIKDAKTLKVIEVLHPYTFEDRFNTRNTMKITPHATVDVPFFISRTVHTDHTRETSVDVENYVYTNFDKTRDKPISIESYVPDTWPFKSTTQPIRQEAKK